MIKIMNYGQVSNNEIFARPVEKENVVDTNEEIKQNNQIKDTNQIVKIYD